MIKTQIVRLGSAYQFLNESPQFPKLFAFAQNHDRVLNPSPNFDGNTPAILLTDIPAGEHAIIAISIFRSKIPQIPDVFVPTFNPATSIEIGDAVLTSEIAVLKLGTRIIASHFQVTLVRKWYSIDAKGEPYCLNSSAICYLNSQQLIQIMTTGKIGQLDSKPI